MSNAAPLPGRDSTGKDIDQSAEQDRGIITPFREINTSQGSEFLDDAIRVKDQPFKYNESKMPRKDPRSLL